LKTDHTIVIVTHNLQQAARVSDFAGFMYLGQLVEFDTAHHIVRDAERAAHAALCHGPLRLKLQPLQTGENRVLAAIFTGALVGGVTREAC